MKGTHKKNVKRFAKLARPFGLELEISSHIKIRRGGVTVGMLSGSPRGVREIENEVRRLVKKGHLPESFREHRFR